MSHVPAADFDQALEQAAEEVHEQFQRTSCTNVSTLINILRSHLAPLREKRPHFGELSIARDRCNAAERIADGLRERAERAERELAEIKLALRRSDEACCYQEAKKNAAHDELERARELLRRWPTVLTSSNPMPYYEIKKDTDAFLAGEALPKC